AEPVAPRNALRPGQSQPRMRWPTGWKRSPHAPHFVPAETRGARRDGARAFQASGKELNAARSAESLALQLFPGRQSQTPREMLARRAQPTTEVEKPGGKVRANGCRCDVRVTRTTLPCRCTRFG